MSVQSNPALSPAGTVPQAGVAVQAVFAMVLGLMIVGLSGFAPIEAIHNAAHDTRHANGFPCH